MLRIELDDLSRPQVLALLQEHLRNMYELSPPDKVFMTRNLLVGDVDEVSEGVRAYALDPVRAAALWAKSEGLVGEHF